MNSLIELHEYLKNCIAGLDHVQMMSDKILNINELDSKEVVIIKSFGIDELQQASEHGQEFFMRLEMFSNLLQELIDNEEHFKNQ